MARSSVIYVCSECGAEHAKWQGQCSACQAWNTLKEFRLPAQGKAKAAGAPGYGGASAEVALLADVAAAKEERFRSGLAELDRVLGGGFVPGSVVLMGGDPALAKARCSCKLPPALMAQKQGPLFTSAAKSRFSNSRSGRGGWASHETR